MAEIGQLPGVGEVFLDHLAHFVPDMEAAHRDLNELGFVQTPYTLHQHTVDGTADLVPSGTANRCIMFGQGYVEIIAVSDAGTPLGQRTQQQMERYVGLHLIAFSTRDIEGTQGRLTHAGFVPSPLVHLKRPVSMPDGSEREARFTCCRVREDKMPEGRLQFLTHQTEAEVWQDRWMNHGNAIVGLRDVIICVENLEQAVARYCWFLDHGTPKRLSEHTWRVPVTRGGVVLVDEDGLEELLPGAKPPDLPFIAGYGLVSSDLARTRSFWTERGLKPIDIGSEMLRLDLPDSLGGSILVSTPDLVLLD